MKPRLGVYGPLAILVAGLALAAVAGDLARHASEDTVRDEVRGEAERVAATVRLAVDRRLALLPGLAAFVATQRHAPAFRADFDRYGEALVAAVPGVRTVQWVEDGIVQLTIPLAGNEAAVGLDIARSTDPDLSRSYRRAAETTMPVLTEPRALVQGGQGAVGRLAVREPDGRLLGLVAVVFDMNAVLEEAGLTAGERPHDVAIADSGGGPIFGTPPGPEARALVAFIELPDRRWQVAVSPRGGWSTVGRRQARLASGVVFGFAVLLALLLATWARRRDAIQRLRREELRRQADERFIRLFQLSPDGVAVTRLRDGVYLEVSDSFLGLSGLRREEVVGRSTLDLGHWANPDDRQRITALLEQDGICRNVPVVFRVGTREVHALLSSRIIDVDGEPCMLSLVRDVTEQRQLERQLAISQRMDAVGRLAGGLAHDFNNLLTAIRGYAELMLIRAADSTANRDLEEIVRTADRGAGLTRKLLAFARHQVQSPRVLEVNALVKDTTSLLQRLIGEQVRLELALDPRGGRIWADPGSMEQVLVNLAVNARDAMPSGGVLRIETRSGSPGVVIEVNDTGHGIADEHLPHIFEPFYTTRDGKGTGLGLATCYGLIHQAGGQVEVQSTVGVGTRFRITLPELTGPSQPVEAAPAPAPAHRPGGSETILVAEDDGLVREVVLRTLTGLGYTVLAASDGHEALGMAAAFGESIHLLLTDAVMPGLSGSEVARRLRESRPDIKVLVMSGYASDLAQLDIARRAGAGFIAKPFTTADLAAAVRSALDHPA